MKQYYIRVYNGKYQMDGFYDIKRKKTYLSPLGVTSFKTKEDAEKAMEEHGLSGYVDYTINLSWME